MYWITLAQLGASLLVAGWLGALPADYAGFFPATGEEPVDPVTTTVRTDVFHDALFIFDIATPYGVETVRLHGFMTVEVNLAAIGDPDSDTREQVPAEITSMDFWGDNSALGTIFVRLSPFVSLPGEIEEHENATPLTLDIPPYTSSGSADSVYDVFFRIEFSTISQIGQNVVPKRFTAQISHSPAGPYDVFDSPEWVDLFDEYFWPIGWSIGPARLAPIADGDVDGVPFDRDNCPEVANTRQRDTNGDDIGNACDADLTGDCIVNFADLAALASAFTPRPYDPDADFDGDGSVNFGDLAFLKSTFFNGANPGPGPGLPGNACD